MKQKYFNYLIIIVCLYLLINFFLNKELVFYTITISLNIWLNNLLPSLFPIFILSDILINYNFINYIPNPIKKFLSKLFNISPNATLIFLLSIISGFPSNARNTRELYNNNLITREEASHILSFTHFANPLFILGAVSIFFLKNKKLGLIIFLSHYLSNIILGIILRKKNSNICLNSNIHVYKSQSFGHIFTESIKKAIDTLFVILGTITCFLIIATIITNKLQLNGYLSMIIKSILEITIGLKELSLLNLSDFLKVIISSMIISFGGFSVHMQVMSFIENSNISYKPFFIGRIYQVLISGLLSIIFYYSL